MKAVWLLLFLVACAGIALTVLWLNPGAAPVKTETSIPDDAVAATVNYVHDGDTLFLDTPDDPNLKARLLAVDTPEVGDCYGAEATALLRQLAPEGSTVYTLADEEPLDQYGRALLFVWTESGEL